MSVERGYDRRGGRRMGYYRRGETGEKHYYTPGDEAARKRAKRRAEQAPDREAS